jgi:hypothetical protein
MKDLEFYEVENKLLRETAKHWQEMYENLYKDYEQLVYKFDSLVTEACQKIIEDKKND